MIDSVERGVLMTSNLLVVTMGTTWQVIPELVGFTNPELGIYEHHSELATIRRIRDEFSIEPISRVWVITTGGTDRAADELRRWSSRVNIRTRLFRLPGVEELASVEECKYMADFIYRVVLQASEDTAKDGGKLYLSLAGGRKTMSAEMQQAGNLFGCAAMLHVVDKRMTPANKEAFGQLDFAGPAESRMINFIMPLVTFGKIERNMLLDVGEKITAATYGVSEIGECRQELYKEIRQRRDDANNLFFNYLGGLTAARESTNFRVLYALPPGKIAILKQAHFTYAFVKKLPKAELHCHFGGIASPAEMVEIARAEQEAVTGLCRQSIDFANWNQAIENLIVADDLNGLRKLVPDVKMLRKEIFPRIPEPFCVAAFLLRFAGRTDLLEKFIYGTRQLKGIGIEAYEKLGDLQGSGLLQSAKTIREAARVLIRQCREHNVRYIEVRCSPINYTRGELAGKPDEVIRIMTEEFEQCRETYFNLLFIASRHGQEDAIEQHVALARTLLAEGAGFFAGFDLAGTEGAKSPQEMRDLFMPLMEKCICLTIHAGETEAVDSIWEAVYHLNADRIGHGLKLADDHDLTDKIKNKRITIEMCPSSNDQIVGFDRNYPLLDYLEKGLKVTVNTDNPGISRTDFSREYIKVNELSRQPLSQWQILQLIKNSFRGAFVNFEKKRELILNAEKEIVELLQNIPVVS